MQMIKTISSKSPEKIQNQPFIRIYEDMDDLMQKQHEELIKYGNMLESDEEKLKNKKPKQIKQKAIVLKDRMKKTGKKRENN